MMQQWCKKGTLCSFFQIKPFTRGAISQRISYRMQMAHPLLKEKRGGENCRREFQMRFRRSASRICHDSSVNIVPGGGVCFSPTPNIDTDEWSFSKRYLICVRQMLVTPFFFFHCPKERSNKLNLLKLPRMRKRLWKHRRQKTSWQLKLWPLHSWCQNQETLPLQTKAVRPDATAARPHVCASRTSQRKKQSPATWTEWGSVADQGCQSPEAKRVTQIPAAVAPRGAGATGVRLTRPRRPKRAAASALNRKLW